MIMKIQNHFTRTALLLVQGAAPFYVYVVSNANRNTGIKKCDWCFVSICTLFINDASLLMPSDINYPSKLVEAKTLLSFFCWGLSKWQNLQGIVSLKNPLYLPLQVYEFPLASSVYCVHLKSVTAVTPLQAVSQWLKLLKNSTRWGK